MSWNRLEHQVWNQLKRHDIKSAQFILAVSGGLDSMVLLRIMRRLNLNSPLIVAHFHHGPSVDPAQTTFRNLALAAVQRACEMQLNPRPFQRQSALQKVNFICAKSKNILKSEADFRKARRAFINSILKQYPRAIVMTAHHQNDLLETFILKMMRSSGVSGLSNFQEFNGQIFRPFIQNQKSALQTYAKEQKIQWVDDPSNQDTQQLRNWLRHDLFPQLEIRHSGALRNLFTSIDRLIKEAKPDLKEDHLFLSVHRQDPQDFSKMVVLKKTQKSCVIEIDRTWYKNLDRAYREDVVFLALKQAQRYYFRLKDCGVVSDVKNQSAFWDITSGRVKEIIKRLDKNQKDLKFMMGPLKALTTSKKIMLQFKL